MEDNSTRQDGIRLRTWGPEVRVLPGAPHNAYYARKLVPLVSSAADWQLTRAIVALLDPEAVPCIIAPAHAVSWDGDRGIVEISWLREAAGWRMRVEVGGELDLSGYDFESHTTSVYQVDENERCRWAAKLNDRVSLTEGERHFVCETIEKYAEELRRRLHGAAADCAEARL